KSLIVTPGWQTVGFNCTGEQRDPVVPFTGNGVVNGDFGVLESLAFTIEPPYNTGRYVIYIDSITNGSTLLTGFDTVAPSSSVMFRKPRFGYTASNQLLAYPDTAQTDPAYAADGSLQSYRVEFQFWDAAPTRWTRLTTFDDASTPDIPLQNPLVDL